MKIKITKTSGPDLQALLKDIPRRVKNVATEVGRAVSEQTATEVKRRLGGHGGWVRIYYNSIIFREGMDGDNWAVAGINETHPKLFEDSAETTLLNFDSASARDVNSLVSIVANNNPWPIDVIPVIEGGYPGTATVRMYDQGTVETIREARLRNLPGVIEALKAAGGRVDESGDNILMIDRLYADLAYMAKRLELGFHGYPRIPHWGPAASKLAAQGEKWASTPSVLRLLERAVKGKEPGKVATMSPAQASELVRIREASWS